MPQSTLDGPQPLVRLAIAVVVQSVAHFGRRNRRVARGHTRFRTHGCPLAGTVFIGSIALGRGLDFHSQRRALAFPFSNHALTGLAASPKLHVEAIKPQGTLPGFVTSHATKTPLGPQVHALVSQIQAGRVARHVVGAGSTQPGIARNADVDHVRQRGQILLAGPVLGAFIYAVHCALRPLTGFHAEAGQTIGVIVTWPAEIALHHLRLGQFLRLDGLETECLEGLRRLHAGLEIRPAPQLIHQVEFGQLSRSIKHYWKLGRTASA